MQRDPRQEIERLIEAMRGLSEQELLDQVYRRLVLICVVLLSPMDRGTGEMTVKLLLTGRPGCGKTTVIRRVVELLKDRRLAGFLHAGDRRIGLCREIRGKTAGNQDTVDRTAMNPPQPSSGVGLVHRG